MTEALNNILTEAIEDEYKARATYRRVLEEFGDVRPFSNIVEAEQRHIDALLVLFEEYGLHIPGDSWADRVETPTTLLAACQAGVAAEIDNAAMYDRLLAASSDYPAVQRVLCNLQRASRENHLPAFQRCVERENRQLK
ncbi:ferritin-like domain-containing protein [Thiohalophilus sp.]|uniref:ferritin-like domain-containing protein n=1 Tax=Thiohalophilus sp. TaxID=3028392 RepID=UPI003975842B